MRARSRSRDVEIGESKRRNSKYQAGKRKSTSKSASLRLMQKRLLLYIRRNRHQSTGLMIGLIIFVLIFISMSRHKNVVGVNNQLSFESLDLSFDIIFKETRSESVNIVSMPKSLGLILHDDDTEDEYGNLDIWLLEEEDARRNIWFDSRKYRTDYRLPDAEHNERAGCQHSSPSGQHPICRAGEHATDVGARTNTYIYVCPRKPTLIYPPTLKLTDLAKRGCDTFTFSPDIATQLFQDELTMQVGSSTSV